MMKRIWIHVLIYLSIVRADITLPGVFSDGMILQRDMPAALFGTGAPGITVSVTLEGQDGQTLQTKTALVQRDNRWRLALDPMGAGGPYTLRIRGGDAEQRIRDVLFGEVWLMSGQSNMAGTVGTTDYAPHVEGDDFPDIRAFNPQHGWVKATSFNIQFLFAQAYFFAREVYQAEEGRVPVGFYSGAYVNSAIHEWMDPLTLAAHPESSQKSGAGRHYNNLIRPVMGYTFRGMIWDQGENNGGLEANSTQYGQWLRDLITHWRALSRNPQLLVIVPQLPILRDEWRQPQAGPVAGGGSDRATRIRQGQFEAMALPGVYLVPTWDISDGDIHPRNAPQKGERAARIYRNVIQRQTAVGHQGPTFLRQEPRENSLVLHFIHVGHGLALDPSVPATLQAGANPAADLLGMAIAGEDGVFHWASGVLGRDTLTLTSPHVARPVQARYVWADDLRQFGNLLNSAGLPTPGFRSDGSVTVFQPGAPVPALPQVPEARPPADNVYEGELADVISRTQSGRLDFQQTLSGGAYLAGNGPDFASEWSTVRALKEGAHALTLRYRSRGGLISIQINDEKAVSEFRLPDTEGVFQALELPLVTLVPGIPNRIKIHSASGNQHSVDIDALEVHLPDQQANLMVK